MFTMREVPWPVAAEHTTVPYPARSQHRKAQQNRSEKAFHHSVAQVKYVRSVPFESSSFVLRPEPSAHATYTTPHSCKLSTRTQPDTPVHTGRHSGRTTVKQTQMLKPTHVCTCQTNQPTDRSLPTHQPTNHLIRTTLHLLPRPPLVLQLRSSRHSGFENGVRLC